jgi:hypothetical protein
MGAPSAAGWDGKQKEENMVSKKFMVGLAFEFNGPIDETFVKAAILLVMRQRPMPAGKVTVVEFIPVDENQNERPRFCDRDSFRASCRIGFLVPAKGA